MNVAENIKSIRKAKGFTQKQLAEKTGLSISSIQQFEYGKIEPTLETVLKLASVLEVTPFEINGVKYFDMITDTEKLSNEVKFYETFISLYGEEKASFFNDFLSLNPEGQQKVLEYISLLIPKYKQTDTHSKAD